MEKEGKKGEANAQLEHPPGNSLQSFFSRCSGDFLQRGTAGIQSAKTLLLHVFANELSNLRNVSFDSLPSVFQLSYVSLELGCLGYLGYLGSLG